MGVPRIVCPTYKFAQSCELHSLHVAFMWTTTGHCWHQCMSPRAVILLHAWQDQLIPEGTHSILECCMHACMHARCRQNLTASGSLCRVPSCGCHCGRPRVWKPCAAPLQLYCCTACCCAEDLSGHRATSIGPWQPPCCGPPLWPCYRHGAPPAASRRIFRLWSPPQRRAEHPFSI